MFGGERGVLGGTRTGYFVLLVVPTFSSPSGLVVVAGKGSFTLDLVHAVHGRAV